QSDVDPDEALYWAAFYFERVGKPSREAARKALDALLRDGVRVLSLFEVLVFTYYWHRKHAASGGLVVGNDGWALQGPSSHPEASPSGGSGVNQEADVVSHHDAAEFLLPVLMSLSGSRQASKVSALPSWLSEDIISQGDILAGLQRYAKVSSGRVI
ncbi:unnamed protein product, partial [Pylaiella littoralis]